MSSLNLALAAVLGTSLSYFGPIILDIAQPSLEGIPFLSKPSAPWSCAPHNYTTELVSLEPLVIYIHNFVSPEESELIVKAGRDLLVESPVTGYGSESHSQARTSVSAPLPGDDAAVQCVLQRAEAFMGTMMAPGRDEMGVAQMVHYTSGQKFDLHHDWFKRPRVRDGDAGRKRMYNRLATFFVVLQENCTEGETYFPEARPVAPQDRGKGSDVWREHESGGIAFMPIAGNAVFWPNLLSDGSGDPRTLHAGLPVGEGTKTAMNIWPRVFFGPEA
ncbi:uncharacterized protein DNG_03955 [Cephalotrichum gorgonifer]|uniref:Prolyl 4-hydroxylase alpha subunit domain-containing protein n=1 Tax=Cephalotrichum gorgonifer TaxID=2041049 RepID=A0AAE8MXJ1_9PEZI|nr:uncharacterized protein DNG_03955 [Cephalotrichum gorgonifer]